MSSIVNLAISTPADEGYKAVSIYYCDCGSGVRKCDSGYYLIYWVRYTAEDGSGKVRSCFYSTVGARYSVIYLTHVVAGAGKGYKFSSAVDYYYVCSRFR